MFGSITIIKMALSVLKCLEEERNEQDTSAERCWRF